MKSDFRAVDSVWLGPCAAGWNGGVTQSMLGRFLCCRERFRIKYILGLEPHEKWNHRLGYGNMWHVCEEALASEVSHFGEVIGTTIVKDDLQNHIGEQFNSYPLQREEIAHWGNVCAMQFPEYVKFWQNHPDVRNRTPLFQERVFDVPYRLPSGRIVRLRGKFDAGDLLIDETTGALGGVYLQENKTKGDIDRAQVERQLDFDLQTMFYLTALYGESSQPGWYKLENGDYKRICGVRYNVVRRPLSGGKGNIKPHAAKSTKKTFKAAETMEAFYERLRRDYIAAEPDYWFFRLRCEISEREVSVFRQTCLDPVLEQLCDWYQEVTGADLTPAQPYRTPLNYRHPFGIYNPLEENGATEYDAYMRTGSVVGFRRITELFSELKS